MNFFHLATCDLARPYFRVTWQMTKTAGDGAPVAPYVMAVKWRKFLFTISDLAERRGEAHKNVRPPCVRSGAFLLNCQLQPVVALPRSIIQRKLALMIWAIFSGNVRSSSYYFPFGQIIYYSRRALHAQLIRFKYFFSKDKNF